MINIYDGNNVLLRSLTGMCMPGQGPMTMRQRLWSQKPTDIWVWDGIDHNSRRQELYPPYKGNRKPSAEDHFAQISLFKDLLQHTPAIQITARRWEADDVVYTLAKKLKTPLTIHSNDADYLQLLRFPNVELKGPKRTLCPPQWLTAYKAVCGDSSDNIAGVPGFGPKTWEALDGHYPALIEAMRAGLYEGFAELPLPKRVLTWLASEDNRKELQNMFLITHMWDVPEDEISAGTTVGTPNPTHVEATLTKFFL